MSPRSAVILMVILCACASGQQPAHDTGANSKVSQPDGAPPEPPDKRIFGVLPNYRTVEGTGDVEPQLAREKFRIAFKDSFDYPIYFISGAFAGISQIENSNPSFGQGVKGYVLRYAAGYGDQMIGNMMTEGLFPVLLHEDMRYFRRGAGRKMGRTWYALTRVIVTRTDDGRTRFNYSEIVGNSVATAISNAYNPDTRDASENLEKLGLQVGTDAISNVLKEFWPDVKRKIHHNQQQQPLAPVAN